MKHLKPLKPLNKKDIENGFFVFDIETTCLEPTPENFVFGCVYGFDYVKTLYSVEDFKVEFMHKRYKGKYLFAHNAEFDLSGIFGNIYTELDNSAIFNGKFISASWNERNFVDSMNLLPTSVYNLGKILGIEKLDNQKVKIGGLTKNNITDFDVEYCKMDCQIVFDSLLKMFKEAGAIKITIASLAMYDFRKNFLEKEILYNDYVDNFFDSYYGGRTEAFKIGVTESKVYDINSMYPYVMSYLEFPDVRNLKFEEITDVNYLHYLLKRFEGCCTVKVKHKDTYFGYLPKKYVNEKNETKLIFPTGVFWVTVNFNELRYAIESGVVELLECKDVTYALPVETPFKNFVGTKFDKRQNTQDEFLKLFLKLTLNSLYGKFAMRMKFETTYYEQIPFEIIQELNDFDKFNELKIFSKDRSDCFLITENDKFKKSFFSIATFSSYITSEARVLLLKSLVQNEQNCVTYCDTDSVFLEGVFKGDEGLKLGEFKREDKTIVEIKGLKNYIDIEGKRTLKGVHKNAEKISENSYKITQYHKTKEALRRNVETGSKKVVIKNIKNNYDKRVVNSDGTTQPIKLNEL